MEARILDMLSEMNHGIKHLNGRFDTMQSDLTEMKTDIHELKTDVGVLKADVTELKDDLTVLKTDVAELKDDVAVLKTDVAVLKTDVAELKGDVNILKIDMVDAKNDIANLMDLTRRQELHMIRMENKMDDKFAALFDGYKANTESILRLENTIKHHPVKLRIVE